MRIRKKSRQTALREFRITIRRSKQGEGRVFRQTFLYTGENEGDSVMTALLSINSREDLRDEEGRPADPISFESSCLQKRCGACAMLINGEPRLACDTPLRDLPRDIELAPLRKFPVVRDLLVDRGIMQKNLADLRVWMETDASYTERTMWDAYDASLCLQCGLCLEVCPGFSAEGSFTGAASVVPVSRIFSAQNRAGQEKLKEEYRKRVFEGCAKSLACEHICPAGIPVGEKLAQSNAAAVWKRHFGKRKGK